MMLLTIIVPIHNMNSNYENLLIWVSTIKNTEIEIILIDDFTNNNESNLIDELFSKYEQVRIVKFSAKKIRSSELTPVELAASYIQIFVPLSDVGFCMVDAATLRYGSVYIAESDAKNSIQPHKMRNRDYYLLVINCAKT